MVDILDSSIEDFLYDIERKSLFLFGAGTRASYLYDGLHLCNKVTAVVDNNKKLQGEKITLGREEILVIGIEELVTRVMHLGKERVRVLITTLIHPIKIIEGMNAIEELNGLKCYLGNLLSDHYETQEFSFSIGTPLIPKKIHYCWFGGTEIPDHLQIYMRSWKEKCPDYEIIRWDESNYDITKNQYMYGAYQSKKWGFVPDYARLDIIYQEGGIYLDTDIEVISSLDVLLNNAFFAGAGDNFVINTGGGFGAEKGNQLIRDLRDYYNDKSFFHDNGSLNLSPCAVYQKPVFEKYGFRVNNQYQLIDNMVIYPSEVLSPKGTSGVANNFTDHTVSIHHLEASWCDENSKKALLEYRKAAAMWQNGV